MTASDACASSDAESSFLRLGSEMSGLIRRYDWAKTPLGPLEQWPQSLKTTTGMLLQSPVPIVLLWGVKGIMIYNDAYSGFAGQRHPKLLGSEVRQGWEEVADFNDNVMKVGLAGGTLVYKDQELTLQRHGEPERLWTDLYYSPVPGDDGAPAGVIAVVVETTERVLAQARIRESESRLRFLDALSRETTRTTDSDSILRTTTRMLGEHLGVSVCAYADMDADEDGFNIRGDWSAPGSPSIVGRYRLSDFGQLALTNLHAGQPLILNDLKAELPAQEAAAFISIGLAATICMPLVKEGRLTALMAIHDKAPRLWSFDELTLLREVTERSWAHIERVRSEAEVRRGERRFREELEGKVAERTAALLKAEQALHHLQKMEAIGNLTGGIAHDFNNLLMAVLGSLELLRKRIAPDPAALRLLDNAQAGAERGASLTSRMLSFARRQELRTEKIDLRLLVEGITELMQRSLGATITLELDLEPELPWVETDPNQLESALLNLALNARDAMEGQGTIRISARSVSHPEPGVALPAGAYVCLALADSGAGMDEVILKRATEPFFTTKGLGKGTGLGLSMVLGLAQQSGGTLTLSSRQGAGTTASIWLPACKPGTLQPALSPEAALYCASTRMQNQAQRILAVDDDQLVLTNTAEMLEELGYQVVRATSAQEALSLLEPTQPTLLLTDHAMPQMTGTQLALEVQRRMPGLPVLLVTGYAELPPGQRLDAPRLDKPFTQAQLAGAVSALLYPVQSQSK